MKTLRSIVITGMFLFCISSAFAGIRTEKLKVYGKCESCKTRIEKAASSVNGVTKAIWNEKDLMLTVTYDDSRTNVTKIAEAEAKVGHDTDKIRANDKVYNDRPACCHYDRPKK